MFLMEINRELSVFERALTITDEFSPLNVVTVLQLAHGPQPDRLRRTLDELQARHPLLRAHLRREGKRYLFEAPDTPPIPLSLQPRHDDEHWREVAEQELNQRLDAQRGPLLRVRYLQSADLSEIIFTFHHTIVDAESGTALLHELLSMCAAESSPASSANESEGLQPTAQLFPASFRGWGRLFRTLRFIGLQLIDELRYTFRMRGQPNPPIHSTARSQIYPWRLPPQATASLIRRARIERVTLNSVLNAALLLAVQKELYHDQPRLLRTMAFANLRPYLKPPVPNESLGCYISMFRLTMDLTGRPALWPLARAINQNVYEIGQRGDKFAATLLSEMLIKATIRLKSMRLGAGALSYAGAVGLQENYGSIEVRGLNAFISNYVYGPQYTAAVRLFRGELWWDVLYLDRDLDRSAAEAVAREIEHILAGADRPSG
jgi:hypothetical protein